MRSSLYLPLTLAGLLLAVPAGAQTCTTSWTNPAGGAWTTAANWDAGVPDASDNACITLAGTYTVTVSGFSVNSLTLGATSGTGNQTLVNSGAFSFGTTGTIRSRGIFEWTSNYLEGGTLVNQGLLRLTGGTTSRGVRNAGSLLRNAGTVTWTDTGYFYVYSDGVVENESVWDVAGDGDLYGSSGVGTFSNEAGATFRRSAGTPGQFMPISSGGLVFDNAGTIDVQVDEVRFDRPSTHTGAVLTTSAGATLNFNSGGVTFVGTVSGNQAGILNLNDDFTAGDNAVWAFTGSGIEWTGNYLTAGTLVNQGLIRLTGGTTSRGVRGATALLRNTGTVTWTDTGYFYIYDSAVVENESVWDVAGDGDLYGSSGVGTFSNEAGAIFRKSAGTLGGTPISSGGLVFNNAGTIDVQAGEVEFSRPSTHTNATLTTSAGAVLDFNSGGVTFAGTISGSPSGSVNLNDGFTTDATLGATWSFSGSGIEWTSDYLE